MDQVGRRRWAMTEKCLCEPNEVIILSCAGWRKKRVKIKNVVLNLSSEETLRLTRILLDEDKDEALAFLRECLKPQLVEATRDH